MVNLNLDVVILKRRTWSVAAAIGPVVGGSLANIGQWRWLFCELI